MPHPSYRSMVSLFIGLLIATSTPALQLRSSSDSAAFPSAPSFVEGRITRDDDGQPVVGATVRLQSTPYGVGCATGWQSELSCDFVDATTDAEGCYRLRLPERLALSSLYVLPSRGAGSAILPPLQRRSAGADKIGVTYTSDAAVGPGHTLEGLVLDEHAQPLAGAEILVWQILVAHERVQGRRASSTKAPDLTLKTKHDGTFFIPAIGASATVRIQAPEFIAERLKLALGAEEDSEPKRIQMVRERFIDCSIVDEHGEPASKVRVSVTRGSRHDSPRATDSLGVYRYEFSSSSAVTDEHGRCRVGPLPRGTFDVSVTATSYLPLKTTMPVPSDEVALTLSHGVALGGRVVGRDGTPLQGAQVWTQAYGPSDEGSYGNAREVTSSDGRFEFTGVPSGKTVILKVSADGYASRLVEVSTTEVADALDVDVRLLPERTLSGQLLDPDGAPLAYREISLCLDLLSGGKTPLSFARWGTTAFLGTLAKQRTDAEGRFVMNKLPSGPYLLRVETEKQLFRTDEGPAPVTIQLRPPQESRRRILARVTAADTGQPLIDYDLGLSRDFNGSLLSDTTVRDGATFIVDLRRDGGHLILSAPGYALWREALALPDYWDYPREIALEPARSLTLRTVTQAGDIAPNVILSFTRSGNRPVEAVRQDGKVGTHRFSSGSDGLTHFDSLPSDTLAILMHSSRYEEGSKVTQRWEVDLRDAESPSFLELVIDEAADATR